MEKSENKSINDLWVEIQKLHTEISELKEYIVEMRIQIQEGPNQGFSENLFDDGDTDECDYSELDDETIMRIKDKKGDFEYITMKDTKGRCTIVKKYVLRTFGIHEDLIFGQYEDSNKFYSEDEANAKVQELNRLKGKGCL